MTALVEPRAGFHRPEQARAVPILLVRPASFGFNPQAAATNHFACPAVGADGELHALARGEFDAFVTALDDADVETLIIDDEGDRPKPDAVFSNNWMSFHADGTAVLYPMANPVRRLERRRDDVERALARRGLCISRWVDLTWLEAGEQFLEGTGSLVIDHRERVAYACLSGRTHSRAITHWSRETGHSVLSFRAADPAGRPIYHTNVMMSLGERFALVCLAAVAAPDRRRIASAIEATGRTLIDVSWDQVRQMACNVLELHTKKGTRVLALSSGAAASLTPQQVEAIERLCGRLVHSPLPVIERVGGGGARCMMTEVRLPTTAPVARDA